MTAVSSEEVREHFKYQPRTVIDLAPYWLLTDLQRLLGERALKATREGDVDEMRRLTEGIEWLKRRVYLKNEAPRV